MAIRKRLTRTLFWTSAGAAAAYLYDPELGRSRRTRLQDQATARLRQVRRQAERKGRYVQSAAEGKAEQLTQSKPTAPPDDRTLVDKIRSEVLGHPPYREYKIVVDAVDGVVTLRGELPDASAATGIEGAVGAVPGVREVRNLLHPGDAPAPNKEESVSTSAR